MDEVRKGLRDLIRGGYEQDFQIMADKRHRSSAAVDGAAASEPTALAFTGIYRSGVLRLGAI